MSEPKTKTKPCNFCHGAESYGHYAPAVHKMYWYMAHSKVVTLELLKKFEGFMAEEGTFFDTLLTADGNPYPGMEVK